VKANASEPLMKGRKELQTVSKPGQHQGPGNSVGEDLLTTGMTPGLKAARSWIRLRHGTLEPVVSMQRERHKRSTRKADSTNARHRGGTIRSSDEWRVMRRERRDRVIQFSINESTVSNCGRNL
jgi:hypothetical protein